MAHITIEYVIMIPLLISQIILFPLVTSWLMNIWTDKQRTLALQEIASHLGSIIQQVFLALNHTTVSAGTVTQEANVPPLIENYPYTGTATLRSVSGLGSSKVLDITLRLGTIGITVTSSAILGSNVLWQESTFVSNSINVCITATKFWDGDEYMIQLSFGG